MNKGQASEERASNWEPDLKVPPTTLWLPLGSDLPAKELGKTAAANILGDDAPKDHLGKFARVVADGTTDCRRRGVKLGGLLFYPDYNRLPPIANIDVFEYYSNNPDRPTSLDFYRELYGTPTERTIGPIEVTNLQLPAGPAIRFHSALLAQAQRRPGRPRVGRGPLCGRTPADGHGRGARGGMGRTAVF